MLGSWSNFWSTFCMPGLKKGRGTEKRGTFWMFLDNVWIVSTKTCFMDPRYHKQVLLFRFEGFVCISDSVWIDQNDTYLAQHRWNAWCFQICPISQLILEMIGAATVLVQGGFHHQQRYIDTQQMVAWPIWAPQINITHSGHTMR